jgi:serine/threonine-protein kinase
LAAIHAGLDEKDLAFEWLDRAFEAHCAHMGWLRCEPVWDSLRDDPRFHALLRKMNLD